MEPLYFAHAAAAIMVTLAVLHLGYTMSDLFVRPRYFRPTDRTLLAPIQATTIALAPHGHNFWRALMGFHLSHSIGVLLFAAGIELAIDPALAWIRPFLVAVGFIYALIGWTCWFVIPAAGATISAVLLLIGWCLI